MGEHSHTLVEANEMSESFRVLSGFHIPPPTPLLARAVLNPRA